MKLAIITTHPIQYYAPVFSLLNSRGNINIKVFYTWGEQAMQKYDPGFAKQVTWDVPLLSGYDYEWVENTSADAGSHNYKGVVNPGLIAQINRYKPDALLFFGWAYHGHLHTMRHFKGRIPVYFRGDSILLDRTSLPKKIMRWVLLNWVYSHVDHTFYVGTNNKKYFRKFGFKENQLTFAPHAIDNGKFGADRDEEAKAFRASLHIAANAMLILFAGKFEDKKDPLLLLEAFINVDKPNTHLLFTGNGKLENEMKQRAVGNARVHFIDFQNQSYMPVVYQACDIFCLPSKGPAETWGLAVNEAMASGRAILVSDKTGCAADLVRPGHNGEIFSAASANDLSNKLLYLFNGGKQGLAAMGEASRKIIQEWNFQNIASAIERQLLNEAVHTGKRYLNEE